KAEHPLSHRQPGRSIAEGGDHSGHLVPGNRRRPVTAEAIDPGRGPLQLIPGESRRMNFNNNIAVVRAFKAGEPRRIRIGSLHEFHPTRSPGLTRPPNRFHLKSPPRSVPAYATSSVHNSITDATRRPPTPRPYGRTRIIVFVDVRPQPTVPDPLDD